MPEKALTPTIYAFYCQPQTLMSKSTLYMARTNTPKHYYKAPKEGEIDTRPQTQARRVIEALGGATRVYLILKLIGRPYDKSTIYRWLYDTSKGGTGGLIPTRAWPDIEAALRYEGIIIDSYLIDPRSVPIQAVKYVPPLPLVKRAKAAPLPKEVPVLTSHPYTYEAIVDVKPPEPKPKTYYDPEIPHDLDEDYDD